MKRSRPVRRLRSVAPVLAAWLFAAAAVPNIAVPAIAVPASADTAGTPERATDFEDRQATLSEFEALCRAFRAGDDPYFGTAIVDRLKTSLERPAADPKVRVGRRAGLGIELLRLGDNEQAVRWLEEARDLATELGAPPSLRLQLGRDLAVAYLRLAEARNCAENHTAASCIVPLRPEAIHRDPQPARRAAELFAEAMEYQPEDPTLRWLHAVAVATAGDEESLGAASPWHPDRTPWAADFPRWPQVGMEVGLHRQDLAGGAVMDDFDGDGRLDLISSSNGPCDAMTAHRNLGPGHGFEDVTTDWGLDAQWGGLNFVHADVDGDGDFDLFVLRGGWWNDHGEVRNSLLRNDIRQGRGFVDVTRAAGLAEPAAPTQTAAFADADLDGDLDLYVGVEATPDRTLASRLYLNVTAAVQGPEPQGIRFVDVTEAAGVQNLRYAKGVTWGDVDDDGDPDLYVSNLEQPNRLYRNDGVDAETGVPVFTDVATAWGVTEPLRSFATWFFDADQDGHLDLFVADYSASYEKAHAANLGLATEGGNPRLFLNRGGYFHDASETWGLVRPAFSMGGNFGDLDNDGFPDVYLGTGAPEYQSLMPNVMLHNVGGRRYEDVTYAGGFGHLQKGHGVAFGDLDGDGDQDLFHQLGGQYAGDVYTNVLFENPGPPGHRHLTLRLRGTRSNRFAVGARIEARVRDAGVGDDTVTSRERSVHARVGTGGSFGGNSHQVELGLGAAEKILWLRVRWPSRGPEPEAQTFEGLEPGGVYELIEGEPVAVRVEPTEPERRDR